MIKTILVTGGAGFVGSHTVLELLKNDYEVVIADNLSNSICNDSRRNPYPESIIRIEKLVGKRIVGFFNIDIQDEKSLDYLFKVNHIDAVIHFAALKAVGESCRIPLRYYRNNVFGTICLIEAMKRHGVRKIIFSSSSTVYGTPKYLPIDENHVTGIDITNPYGRTKYFIEEILNDLAKSEKNWCVTHLRYFNPVGAHESGEIGEDPQGEPNNLMPYISQVAIGRRNYLNVFGNDFKTSDGTGMRDYIHIMDLAIGHVMTLNKMFSENWSGSHIYNLGTGRGYTVLEVIAAYEKVSGVKIPYRFVERRLGDIDANFADAKKAWECIGWKSKYTIEDMCRDSWNWQSKYPFGFRKIDDGLSIINDLSIISLNNNNNNNNGSINGKFSQKNGRTSCHSVNE